VILLLRDREMDECLYEWRGGPQPPADLHVALPTRAEVSTTATGANEERPRLHFRFAGTLTPTGLGSPVYVYDQVW
jgi:hypothetical protein